MLTLALSRNWTHSDFGVITTFFGPKVQQMYGITLCTLLVAIYVSETVQDLFCFTFCIDVLGYCHYGHICYLIKSF